MDGAFAPHFVHREADRDGLFRRAATFLTPRNFAIALGLGAALGMVQATGYLLLVKDPFWMVVTGPVAAAASLGVFLLLALAVAAAVETTRVPRVVPFAIAAALATVAAAGMEWLASYLVVTAHGEPFEATAIDVARFAWSETPNRLTVSIFAMLAAMQAADAARRDRALRHLQMEQARVARTAYEARLVALQARVEPRFLFETLSDVEGIYERDPAVGARVMDELIVYLRAALPGIEDTSSSLAVELRLVQSWLDIVRVRSDDHLTYSITDEAPGDARLPPMLLLPLVQHAAEVGPDRTRALFLATAKADDRVLVTIIGPASAFAPAGMSPVVAAVRERVDALYGDTASLSLQPVLHDRSQAILDIPYERTDRRPR